MDTRTGKEREDSDWSIQTFLRLRPPFKSKNNIAYKIENVQIKGDEKKSSRSVINIDIPSDADPGLVHNNSQTGKLKYEFDHVFDTETQQEDMFDKTARDKVHEALEGVNSTIFAYGQTSAGKTYTMCGGDAYASRGLIPRTLELCFSEIKVRQKQQKPYGFMCQVSFTEIYKEVVYDLLSPNRAEGGIENWPVVQVIEAENGILIRNLSVYDVTSEEDALQLFFMGNANRVTSSTAMNMASSRSHAVFTIVLESEFVRQGKTVFTAGKINLVDLAGSERMYKVSEWGCCCPCPC
jgi:kinesin family member 6/9